MSSYTVLDHGNKNARSFDSRKEADEKAKGVKSMVNDSTQIEVVKGEYEEYADYKAAKTDGGIQEDTTNVQPVPTETNTDTVDTTEALDQLGESLNDDPLSILPGHMLDTIQGVPAINKRGYAMISERYGIEVTTTIESYPWDNEEGRCVAKAVAITSEGRRYTGHATACADDGDMKEQIIELADTRAAKRAVSWASGLGIVAYSELSQEL